jgi:alpha-amylase
VVTSSSAASSSTAGTVAVRFTCANGTTYSGQSVYVVGGAAALGNWAVASAVKLSPTAYPSWTGTVQLPANSSIQWKCVKREEANPANGVVWQGGSNNTVATGSGTSVSASF